MRRNTLMSPASVGHSGIWRQFFLLFAGVLMLGFFAPLAAQAMTTGSSAPGELVVKDKTVSEDVGTATVRVALLHRVNHKVSVGWKTVNGTAIAGTDYTAKAGRVVFPTGTKVRHVSVPIINDEVVESTEFFKIRLFDAFRAKIVDRTGIVTIVDNDVPTPVVLPALTVKDASAQEGNPLVFQVSLDKAAKEAVTFDYATSDGTAKAPGDFTATSGKGTIAAGATGTTITVPTTEDSTYEGTVPETMTLTISNVVGAKTATPTVTATGAITDDDQPPTMTIKDPVVQEGSDAVFTVSLSKASEVPAKAEWATHDGTAKAPYDYTAASGVVTIQPGDTTAKISVDTKRDFLYEPGPNETFFVTLSSPHDAVLGMMHTAMGQIIDADHVPAASLTGGSATEGSGVPFKVSIAPRSTQSMSFSWKVEIQAGDTASAADFPGGTLPSGNVTVPAYHDDATFSVPTFNDTLAEHNETFHVVLGGVTPAGAATLLKPSAEGTIIDNDANPTIVVLGTHGPEGTQFTFDVKLSEISGKDVTFNWKTVDGTAKAGVDYTADHGSLTIPAGHQMEQIKVQTLNDHLKAGDKTFYVQIFDVQNATVLHGMAEGLIVDNPTP